MVPVPTLPHDLGECCQSWGRKCQIGTGLFFLTDSKTLARNDTEKLSESFRGTTVDTEHR